MTLRISLATEPNPGHQNEDFVAARTGAVVVLDGAGLPDHMDTGCRHGVPWFVRELGTALLALAADPGASLADCLAAGIRSVARRHGPGCDLGNPLTPSATVALARARDGLLEWLVLADCTVLISGPAGLGIHSDHRVQTVVRRQRAELAPLLAARPPHDRFPTLLRAQREAMNTPGGYWAAAALPQAAAHALTGSLPLAELRTAALLTDGAARLVDDFALLTWPELLTCLETAGPATLIAGTRRAEATDPDRTRWPRPKRHDDATAALLRCHAAAI